MEKGNCMKCLYCTVENSASMLLIINLINNSFLTIDVCFMAYLSNNIFIVVVFWYFRVHYLPFHKHFLKNFLLLSFPC